MRHAGPRVRIDNREIELIFSGVQVDKKVVDFVQDLFRPRVGAVDLVQHHNWRKLGRESLLQNVAGLRQRAFAGVDEEHHAVHHAQGAFDFAAEIAVAGGVHDVDLGVAVAHRRVLGQDGDAALALRWSP